MFLNNFTTARFVLKVMSLLTRGTGTGGGGGGGGELKDFEGVVGTGFAKFGDQGIRRGDHSGPRKRGGSIPHYSLF